MFMTAVCMSRFGASADLREPVVIPSGETDYSFLSVIPNLAQDGKNGFYISHDLPAYEKSPQQFTIYDDDINVVKDFSVERPQFVTKTYSQQKVLVALDLVNINHTGSFDSLVGMGIHMDQSLDMVKDMYGDQADIATLPDGQQVIAYSYAYQELFGHKYPDRFYMPAEAGMEGYFEKCSAEYNRVMGFDPNSEVTEDEYTIYVSATSIVIIPEDGSDSAAYEITRGIFADDYTYLLPIPEQVPFNYGGTDNYSYKKWGTRDMVKGFCVYDTNQKLVQEISLPANHYQDPDRGNYLYYMVLSGKKYIYIRTTNSDQTEGYYLIYRLEGQNKLNLVATAPLGKISPRIPRQGEMVTVEIDERFANDRCLVNVVSADGRNMIQETINPGETSITFNTSNLPQGIYIVKISGKIGNVETSKIIVR